MKKYYICDWIGNILFDSESFKTFGDAWDFLYQKFENEDDDFFDDYCVLTEKEAEEKEHRFIKYMKK